MFSYRHAFHAGNHADVLKHAVFVQLLRHLARKDKPFCCIDTHCGPTLHDLDGAYAMRNAEFKSGITRLWGHKALPPLLTAYLDQVRAVNPGERLRYYPGSPQIATQLLRRRDSLRLFELHSTESAALQEQFRSSDARVQVKAADGFVGLLSVLPPPSRRGLVLIDPSYEDKDDYARVVTALREGLKRFATGVYMVWYPQVQRREAARLPEALARHCQAGQIDWLQVTLTVKRPAADGIGLHGSGLFLVNPPWTLPDMLKDAMPWLVEALGHDAGATYSLECKIA